MKFVFSIVCEIKGFKIRMFKHWQTTLAGALAAACNLIGNHLLTYEGGINWSAIAVSFFLFVLGAMAADHNKKISV
jgi:hypothetical protein